MRLLLAGVALALGSTPAPAQQVNGYEAGVAARQAGDPRTAKRLLSEWLAAHPDDVDARLQLAYADLALGDLDAAQAEFEDVLAQAPGYADAREGLALVAARNAARDDTDRGFVLVEGALSDLTGGARDWQEAAFDFQVPAGEVTLGGRGTYYRRFGLDDVEVEGRIGLHPSDDLWLRVHAGGTPSADFRPHFAIGSGVDMRMGDATVLTFDGEYEDFPLQEVVTLQPGVVQYFADGNAWVTLRAIGTIADGGPLRVGGSLRGDYMPAERWRVFGGVSNGPDTDLGVVTRVTALFGGVEMPLSHTLSLFGSVAEEWRRAGFDRTEFRLGLKAAF